MATPQEKELHNPRFKNDDEDPEGNNGVAGDDDDDDGEEDDFDEEDEVEGGGRGRGRGGRSDPSAEREKMKNLIRRLSDGPVRLRVHDVVIKGNTKTRDSLIEAEVLEAFHMASTIQDLLGAARTASARLHGLDIFDSVSITLDAGPPELPGTANVVINVVESKNPLTGDVGVYSKPEARTWSLEGSLKFKNLFGFGDIWDTSGSYGWDQASEISAGVSLPRFKAISMPPLMARVSLLSQDWLKFSSYTESLLGVSLGLLSTTHHDLAYDLTWRTLTDPSHMSSKSIRRQLGHNLLSSIKYAYKVDKRDSHLRPTRGYAFHYKSQLGGLGPDSKSLRFLRQELDLRVAIPLRICNAALNVGIATGIVTPWGSGFMDRSSPLPERFFIGGHSSPVCGMGIVSLLGFKPRGLGPTDLRRLIPSKHDANDAQASPGTDALGGDLAVTAFADLSFDLPLKLFRDSGIHGHAFVNGGNLVGLTGGEYRNFSFRKFLETFRFSTGCGLVIPTKFIRMEINYCYILKKNQNDRGKTGIQFSFSSP